MRFLFFTRFVVWSLTRFQIQVLDPFAPLLIFEWPAVSTTNQTYARITRKPDTVDMEIVASSCTIALITSLAGN
jgi:hypothetical protein